MGCLEVRPRLLYLPTIQYDWVSNENPLLAFLGELLMELYLSTGGTLLGQGPPTCIAADTAHAAGESTSTVEPRIRINACLAVRAALLVRPQAQAGVAASRMTTDTLPTARNLTAPHSPTLAGAPTTARWVAAGARHGGHRRGLGGRRGYRVACAWHTLRSCPLPPPRELTVSAGVAALARPPPVAVPLGADTPSSPPACSRRTRRTASVLRRRRQVAPV